MDFTLNLYRVLLESLKNQGYSFQRYNEFLIHQEPKSITLRHDVDLQPENSLYTAQMEYELGITGTYYFRVLPRSYNEEIIRQIHNMGHEIGYHYEDFAYCKGNYECAINGFRENLEKLRKIAPVSTICMHGSPMSKWDSRLLWGKYNYKDFGILGEPYFDTDFREVLYLTDTGRRWDNNNVSIRDKAFNNINDRESASMQKDYFFHSTSQIIEAAKKGLLPDKIMITIHPQRWTNNSLPWVKELVFQNIKNLVKRLIVLRS